MFYLVFTVALFELITVVCRLLQRCVRTIDLGISKHYRQSKSYGEPIEVSSQLQVDRAVHASCNTCSNTNATQTAKLAREHSGIRNLCTLATCTGQWRIVYTHATVCDMQDNVLVPTSS
jgi:hypothetical protein